MDEKNDRGSLRVRDGRRSLLGRLSIAARYAVAVATLAKAVEEIVRVFF
ncbi:hypothetical protein [Rugosimonospora africana]|uniref:Uncharacterized protein n=1 Tax=Rugosimonospora africana TaxID=556532 RepID=A0A8J3VWZ0_9ACTN|nr:hypothetical protein [Rugosimonospora africana]GIH21341.1 hypothetical protein Raf01_95130 [Rugosimonospora africana]